MLICLEMQIISFVDGGSVWVIVKKFAPADERGWHSFPMEYCFYYVSESCLRAATVPLAVAASFKLLSSTLSSDVSVDFIGKLAMSCLLL